MKYLEFIQRVYEEGHPILSDHQFDQLTKLVDNGQIGEKMHYTEQEHVFPLWSLDLAFTEEEIPKYISNEATISTPKLDGSAVSLLYKNGNLTSALTRGDGKRGHNILQNMAQLVPVSIASDADVLQIDGEVIAPSSIKNARNYSAGALRLKDPEEFNKRDLLFVAYRINPYPTKHYSTDMLRLATLGFKTVHTFSYGAYPTDGTVVRVNDNERYDFLGYTAKHPRAAIARKELKEEDIKTTELLDVVWQVGKGGKVTPVAVLEPVELEDAIVSKATLHNAGFLEALQIDKGDKVYCVRSGGVIPKILGKV